MKNKQEKLSKDLFENLHYNNCFVKLDETEVEYAYNLARKIYETRDSLSLKDFKNILNTLNERSDIRYFNEKHIDEIASNLKKNFIAEELWRNKHTIDTMGVSIESILFKKGISISKGVDGHSGKHTVSVKFDDEDAKVKYFNSEAEADVYVQNLYKNFVN